MYLKNFKRELWEWVKTIAIAVILVLAIRTFIATPVLVDGASMMPTLEDQDRLVVNKIGPTLFGYDRFDVIVFEVEDGRNFIKRVIGLPGDTVEYQNDQLYVNGEPLAEPYLDASKATLGEGEVFTGDFTLEQVTGETVVPEGHLFVLGDNRVNSTDSRFLEVGFVEEETVMGTTSIVFWPFSNIGIIEH